MYDADGTLDRHQLLDLLPRFESFEEARDDGERGVVLAIPLFLLVGHSFLEVPLGELEAISVSTSFVQLNPARPALIRSSTCHHVRIVHIAISFLH